MATKTSNCDIKYNIGTFIFTVFNNRIESGEISHISVSKVSTGIPNVEVTAFGRKFEQEVVFDNIDDLLVYLKDDYISRAATP